eukprot:CAMPEP_0184707480 /NCGR_PEP_ID=MMETSP0313-20130426/37291_1 /TAXON_ID=2792 /ORGANISM="Porphyridium aerugineum, Strain SAG 1380-2" /LENGTH=489 /DNA_ID=CAMNT_0027169055 /DNA_START=171 /DNA_END=1640 /DNA_ORIENTATION=-
MAPNADLANLKPTGKSHDQAPQIPASDRIITIKELASHATRESAWIAINNRVYDVTGFEHQHPGGEILLTAAGQDASDVFVAFHPMSTYKMLNKFLIGNLEQEQELQPSSLKQRETSQVNKVFSSKGKSFNELTPEEKEEYRTDIKKMRADLVKLKAFDSSKAFYAYKVLSNLLICAISFDIVLNSRLLSNTSMASTILAALLLGLFWQQCGWLAHDFLHHQVFQNRLFNNIAGLFVGNIFQGFSVSWWKMKHNHHHAAPNVTETVAGGDPDIHTYPLLLWSEKLIEGSAEEIKSLPRFLVTNQKIFYWPILCCARVSWVIQSLLFQVAPTWNFVGGNAWRSLEILCLFLHHAIYIWLVAQIPTIPQKLVFMVLSQATGGLFIGVVFTVGHNAMEILTPEEMKDTDFIRMQLVTTRNIDPSPFNIWFSGGLSHQVEHHIWPSLPRHSLPKAREIVMAFCDKYGLKYYSRGLIEGNIEVAQLLARVGASI